MLKRVEVELTSRSPLMTHRYPTEPIEAIEKKSPEEQAEIAAYRMNGPESELYVPGDAVQRMIVGGATYVKGKGRASMQKPVAACILVEPEKIGMGVTEYEIDSRRVVMPSTKGAVIRHRPIYREWVLRFSLEYDDVLVSDVQMRDVVDNAVSRVGLLEYRPACKGPYGRAIVTKWDVG